MTRPVQKFLFNHGEWAIDEIKVKVLDDRIAWIDYWKYEVNAERHRDVVCIGLLDSWKGKTLEQKISEKMNYLKNKLLHENKKIKTNKNIESKFN